MQQFYRIMKYTTKNGVINGTVVYGPKTCGTNTSGLCGASGLFVDQSGAIYYSDRVIIVFLKSHLLLHQQR